MELLICIETDLEGCPECPLGKKQDLGNRVNADLGFIWTVYIFYSENTFACSL